MADVSLGLKRVYDAPSSADGTRVLVDRLWPRGVKKAEANIDVWLKEIAPSPELRQWFSHDAERFEGFSVAYRRQLSEEDAQQGAVKQLLELMKAGPVTLIYAAKDPKLNQAVVLRDYIVDLATRTSGEGHP